MKLLYQTLPGVVATLSFFLLSCSNIDVNVPQLPVIREEEIPELWANMELFIAKNTPANSPTFASRGFGYMGLTMYESVVHGYKNKRSLIGQLNGLNELPQPDASKQYNWPLSLNTGQAFILKNIYQQTSDNNKKKIDSLEEAIQSSIAKKINDTAILKRSVLYGQAVAAAIYEWSKTDGGHRGYLRNFDPGEKMPIDKGSWKPPFYAQTISRFPLHPHWGNNRTFLKTDANWKAPAFMHYSQNQQSEYCKEFEKVYLCNSQLTQQQKEIALWWNDDPSDTYTPPGHSYNLATIILKTKKTDLITATETYARVGMAVADAFITCWKIKYTYCTERPSTYISENIDPSWESFWPDPPFPAFPSGHATQAAAVAIVMSGLFGERMDIVDDTHSARPMDKRKNVEYKTRTFHSFWEVAEETAYSRFLGGIHTNMDNQTGLKQGALIGKHVNELIWNN